MLTKTDLKSVLQTLDMQLLDPDVRDDPQQTAALIADDFIEFGSSGRVFTRKQMIEGLSQEKHTPQFERRLHDFHIRVLADSVALATYRVTRSRPDALTVSSLRSSIWCHKEGRWMMTFHQGTPTHPPA